MAAVIKIFSVGDLSLRYRFEELVQMHWNLVQHKEGQKFKLNWDTLENIERMDLGLYIGAFIDYEYLIGYYAIMFVPSLHTEDLKGGQDMGWFVDPKHRNGGVGLKLLDAAEKVASAIGCTENSVTIKTKAKFPEKILERRSYECGEHRFTKKLTGA